MIGNYCNRFMFVKKIIQYLKDFMSKRRTNAINADNKVIKFIFDDELLDDLYSKRSKKNVSDVNQL